MLSLWYFGGKGNEKLEGLAMADATDQIKICWILMQNPTEA